jgi:hypothetical protein
MRKGFELILVTVLASFAANVFVGVGYRFSRLNWE